MPTPRLIAALISLESGGNDLAIGDRGQAVGALQIHPAVVRDANRIAGTHYTHSGMTNRADAVHVCRIYIGHWATPARIGRPVTDTDRARIWNGGPDGYRSPATKTYGHKIEGILCTSTKTTKPNTTRINTANSR